MKLIKSFIFVVVLFLLHIFGGTVFADNTGVQRIHSIRAYDEDTLVVVVKKEFSSSCPNKHAFRIDNASGKNSHMTKVALSAHLSGKNIKAYLSGLCTPSMSIVKSIEIN